MFQEFYGFTRLPFSRTIATQDLFPTVGQKELGARLAYLVRERGVGLITGEIGCGKSTAVRAFAASLDFNRYLVVYLANPTTGMTGLYRDLVVSLGYEPPFSKPRLVARIRTALEDLSVTKHRAPVVVLDEAHQLPDTATLFFGEQLTAGQIAELARDAEVAARTGAREVAALPDAASGVGPAIRKLRLVFGEVPGKLAQRLAAEKEGFAEALDELTVALDRLASELGLNAERSEDIGNCAQRATDAVAQLARWRAGLAESAPEEGVPQVAWIRWVDVTHSGWQLHASPLTVADVFSKQVAESGRSWVFTSATLAVGGDFSLYQRELGLSDAGTWCWESPFDYESQALLYVPRDLPAPNSREHTEAVVASVLPVLRASGGRAFLLFTTLRALNVAREMLVDAFAREGLDWPLLVQGEGSRSELLTRFRELGNAVLLGSASFREGVDVPGAALSVVIIDKLPFAPPDDPLLAARLEQLRAEGGNPFFDYQLPRAVIALKQGAGRLIRSETDRGVLMICDPRLTDKPYGKRIWRSLPPMRRTRELNDVEAFLAEAR